MKQNPQNWRKKIANYSANGGLIFRVYKELKKKQLKTKNNLVNEPVN